MSHGSYVESPKGDPGEQSGQEFHAGLDEIERRASAAKVESESIEGAIEADTKREAGAVEENRRAETSAKAAPEAEIGVAMVENAVLPAAARVIKTGLDTLSDTRSSASKFTGREAEGLGAGKSARSIDADFTTMKKSSSTIATGSGIESATRGGSLLERSKIASKSLGEQRGTNVGTKANEENSAQLNTARTQVQSIGIANEKVLAQVQAVRAENAHNIGGMTPGGNSAPALRGDARMAKGPAYISPEQAQRMKESMDTSDGSESWA